VFDSGGGIVTGEREGVAAPVGCWDGVELVCMNESDGERAWGRSHGRVQIDVAGTGWGWLGGGGARERERARLGNTRGAGSVLCALARSRR
jgi:hypothetical protein